MKLLAWFAGIILLACCCNLAAFSQSTCDFSDYKPLKNPHSLLDGAVKKVEPVYPSVARNIGAGGQVVVRVLIDREGDVIDSCIVKGHPLLRASSIQATKEWRFKRNFGFIDYNPKENYAEVDLFFNFRLRSEGDKEQQIENTNETSPELIGNILSEGTSPSQKKESAAERKKKQAGLNNFKNRPRTTSTVSNKPVFPANGRKRKVINSDSPVAKPDQKGPGQKFTGFICYMER